jgi:hypothetical protein
MNYNINAGLHPGPKYPFKPYPQDIKKHHALTHFHVAQAIIIYHMHAPTQISAIEATSLVLVILPPTPIDDNQAIDRGK